MYGFQVNFETSYDLYLYAAEAITAFFSRNTYTQML